MEHAVEMVLVLLHTSVLFFFIDLVDFLLPINKTVPWVFLGYIVPFALVYIATTIRKNTSSFLGPFSPSGRGKSERSWEGVSSSGRQGLNLSKGCRKG